LQPVPVKPIPISETGPRFLSFNIDDLDYFFTGGSADKHDIIYVPLLPSGFINDESMSDVVPASKMFETPSDADLAKLLNAFLVDIGKGKDAGGAVDDSTLGTLINTAILDYSSN
jgi:hypothetical protein